MCKLYGKISIKRLAGVVKIVPGVSGSGGGDLQEKTVTPTPDGLIVTPDGGYAGLSRVNVAAPALQTKSVEPGTSARTVQADTGYLALGAVTVKAAPLQSKNVTPSMEVQTVTPDAGIYGLASVAVDAVPVSVDENGYTDIYGLRRLTAVDVVLDRETEETITMTMTLEGDVTEEIVLTLGADRGYPVSATTDGVTCTMKWEGFDNE